MKVKIKRKVTFAASIQEMTDSAHVISIIGNDAYNAIKREDPHPLFVEMKVGQQGISSGPVLIGGIKRAWNKIWGAPRIRELAAWLSRGIPLVFKHAASNSLEGREKVGRTLKGWTEESPSGVVAKALGYVSSTYAGIQEMVRNDTIDGCSIEGAMKLSMGGAARLIVDKIMDLSAVALSRTGVDGVTGFAGAGIVAAVQETAKIQDVLIAAGFSEEDFEIVDGGDGDEGEGRQSVKDRRGGRSKEGRRRGVGDSLTISEVKTFIEEGGVRPERLFSTEMLLKVDAVKDAIDTEVKEQLASGQTEKDTEITDLKKKLDDTKKEVDTKAQEMKDLQDKVAPFQGKLRSEKISDLVKKSELLSKASKKKADYIAKMVAASIAEDADLEADTAAALIEGGIKKQIDDIKEYGMNFGADDGGGEGAGGEGGGEGGSNNDNDPMDRPPESRKGDQGSGKGGTVETATAMFAAGINPLDPDADEQLAATKKK